jgi:ABC-type multidrug transport system ATPase subunit
MDEADRCDRVALIQDGRLLAVDAPARLSAAYDRPLLAVRATDRYRLLQALRRYPHAASVYAFGEFLHYADARPHADAGALRRYLDGEGFREIEVRPIEAGIEDRFMDLMTREPD